MTERLYSSLLMPAAEPTRRVAACRRDRWGLGVAAAFGIVFLVMLPAPVRGQPESVVEIGDENDDGRHTGVDVERALERCRPGCILRAGPHRYEDVAVTIDDRFPEGLVVEGAGAEKTLFRAPVPAVRPVFWVYGGPPGIVFREFALDGRKAEQTNAASIKDSVGIRVTHPARESSPSGRVESVDVGHFLTAGILVRDGKGWRITESRVHDIGCHTDLPCPKLEGEATDPYIAGRRTVGYGVWLVSSTASGATVERNRVADVTKIGIEAYTVASKLGSDARVRDIRILRNRVSGALGAGIVSNGGVDVQIVGNEVWDSGGSGVQGNGGAGVGCGGASARIKVAQNYVHDTDGPGLRLSCQGDGLVVRENHIERVCRRPLERHGAIQIAGRDEYGRGLRVEGNRVDAREGHCAYAILIAKWSDVELTGGRYRGGTVAGLFLANASEVLLGALELSAPTAPPLWVRKDARDVEVGADVQIAREAIKDEGAPGVVIEAPQGAVPEAPRVDGGAAAPWR